MNKNGFSIIELIVAVAIFIVVAVGSIGVLVGSLSLSRLAKEEGVATQLAEQGIEAVASVRDQGWGTMASGTYGLVNTAGVWSLSGTSDITGKYTREIVISEVDAETRDVVSRVSWDFAPTRNNKVELTTRLTNWQGTSGGGVTPTSCAEICVSLSYTAGTCRKNSGACNSAGETRETTGDIFCTGGKNADTCCCQP
jgi:type II secretory pathway pseudopilin PulG